MNVHARPRPRAWRAAVRAALVVVAAVVLVSCASQIQGNPAAAPPPSSEHPPFEPCQIIDWADLPVVAQPADIYKPGERLSPGIAPAFPVDCRFDNSAPVEICLPGPCADGPALGPLFIVHVMWSADPTLYARPFTDGQPIVNYGRRIKMLPNNVTVEGHASPSCAIVAKPGPPELGTVALTVLDGRFGLDPCVVGEELAGKVLDRIT